jgi:hypothetical protein
MFPRGEQQMKKKMKTAAVAGLACTIVATSGCLGINWTQLLITSAVTQLWEFTLDNDTVFDLFEDGGTAQ